VVTVTALLGHDQLNRASCAYTTNVYDVPGRRLGTVTLVSVVLAITEGWSVALAA
jgi:hypothetical protein